MKKIKYTIVLILLILTSFIISSCTFQDSSLTDSSSFRVICLNAGKADAMLLLSDNASIVLDTGNTGEGKVIVNTLKRLGVTSIDYLILTHFDKDHAGGAAYLIEEMDISHILQTYPVKDNDAYHNYLKAVADTSLSPEIVTSNYDFTLDSIAYHVIPPKYSSYTEKKSNNSSLVMQVIHGENTFLFTGDIENERLEELLQDTSFDLNSTFLKVPHHGLYQPLFPEFFRKIAPSYAVITSSEDMPEDEGTLALLDAIDCHTYLTKKGSILFISDGKTIEADQ